MENISEQQLTIFDELYEEVKITKPIRLIELFAVYGSQAMALERLGADFTHHKVIEFDRFAVNSYNAVHGTDFKVTDIRDIHAEDLEVTDTDKYCYIMTYSFPCTDLSVAGKMKGMKKGSGTRSGLIWEVERLLKEMDDKPQVLLMENVPQVHGKKNKEDFQSWISFLESVGYRNYWQDLNAKNYGVAQNRNRCFMISLLGNYSYNFPHPIPLKKKLKDYLEDNVDEKYYINNEKSDKLIKQLIDNGTLPQHNLCRQTCVKEFQNDVKIIGQMDNMIDHTFESANRVYDTEGVAPAMNTCGGGGLQPKIIEEQIPCKLNKMPEGHLDSLDNAKICCINTPTSSTVTSRYYKGIGANRDNMCIVGKISSNGSKQYRIRKLTPRECGRLMGVSDEDIDKMAAVNSNTQLYKQFGNSIVADVLCAIFKQLNIEQVKEN